MRKLIGIFNIKKNTPEQIYEKAQKAIIENERLNLLEMAKSRGKIKSKTKTSKQKL